VNWIIADQTLTSYMGHSFEYARAICEQVRSSGGSATVLAGASVSDKVIEELGAIPCFHSGLDEDFAAPLYPLLPQRLHRLAREYNYYRHLRAVYADLVAQEKRVVLDRHTVVLFPTVRHNQIAPIVKWAKRVAGTGGPRFCLVLRFTAFATYSQPSLTEGLYRRAFRSLERSRVRERFRLFSDSDLLAREYRDHTSLPVEILPIPHVEGRAGNVAADSGNGSPGPIRLTYAGDARTNKGFHLLPYVFEKLAPLTRRGLILGEVQANIRDQSEWIVRTAVHRLRRAGVTLHETELTSADYYALLDRAGIILLPYTLDHYHAQTSGIFAEAMARGKPVIVPRGTWMADQLRTYGAGVTFLPGDRQSLLEAVQSAVESYEPLERQARHRCRAWAAQHNARAFVEAIVNGS